MPDSSREEDARLLESLFASMPVGLAVFDTKLSFRFVNDAFAVMTGASLAEALAGRHLAEARSELVSLMEPCLRQVVETRTPIVCVEFDEPCPTAQRRWLASFYPLASGGNPGVGCVVGEMTARGRSEGSSRHPEDELHEVELPTSRRPNGGLCSLLAPDMLARLGAILVGAEGILKLGPEVELLGGARESVMLIESAARSLETLVLELVDAESIERGVLTLGSTECDVGNMLKDIVEAHLALCLERGVLILLKLSEKPEVVRCDEKRMRDALAHVAASAIRSAAKGSQVLVRYRRLDGHVEISFSLDQVQRPADDQESERPFELRPRGGLGLFIARGIVKAHRGSLSVEAHEVAGKRFVLRLPAGPEAGRRAC